jgi:hypothetical protein
VLTINLYLIECIQVLTCWITQPSPLHFISRGLEGKLPCILLDYSGQQKFYHSPFGKRMSHKKGRVAIIGGGISGLTAGWYATRVNLHHLTTSIQVAV